MGRALGISVIVSHEMAHLRRVCDRFVMLDAGRACFVGAEDALGDVNERIRLFLLGADWPERR